MMLLGLAANAQDGQFNVGVNLGLPVGDSSDAYSFVIGAEVNYLFEVSDQFKVGPSVSYVNLLGKDTEVLGVPVDIPSASFLPLAAAARYGVSDQFTIGADLGYGLGLSPDGNDGGFYYRPMVGYNVSDKVMLQATYSGISVDGTTLSNIWSWGNVLTIVSEKILQKSRVFTQSWSEDFSSDFFLLLEAIKQ